MTDDAATDPPRAANGMPYAVPGQFPSEDDAKRMVEATLEYGWYAVSDRRAIALSGDEPWYTVDAGPQTAAALYAWEPIDPFLFAHSFGSESALDHALRFAREWVDLGLGPTEPDLGTAGRRAVRLGYLAQATGDEDWIVRARDLADALEAEVDPTNISLATTDAVVGLVTLTHRLEAMGDAANGRVRAATESMLTHVDAAFTPDGVHRSQSPGIHAQALDRVRMVVAARSVRRSSLAALRRRAERFLAWMLDPTGAPANIGETPATPLTTAYRRQPSGLRLIPGRVTDPALRHAATAGRFGAPPGVPMEVFADGRFAVIKVPWPHRLKGAKPASHLVMGAGVPDDPSDGHGPVITWHDRGLRLLVEPGPALTQSDHPAAGYAQRAESHNTVSIAMPSPQEIDGRIVNHGSHRNRFHVQARTRLDGATHDRTIVLDPGRWLLVLDRVDGPADADVAVRFHAGDELDLLAAGDVFLLLNDQEPVAWAVPLTRTTPITPERGRLEPRPSGWWSPDGVRMVPNWVFGWDGRGSTTFATLISLEGPPIPDRVDAPWIGWHTAEHRVRVAVTEWGVSDVVVEPETEEEL